MPQLLLPGFVTYKIPLIEFARDEDEGAVLLVRALDGLHRWPHFRNWAPVIVWLHKDRARCLPGKLNSLGLESAAEFRMEGYAEGQADVVLRRAAEARDEVVSLEKANGDSVRSSPVIAAAKCRGEGVVRG